MAAKRIRTVKGVVEWRLCLGCGACAYICPERKISLVDAVDEGIRPLVSNQECGDCRDCLQVCPGFENDHRYLQNRPGIDRCVPSDFGPVLEVWEGHARDPEVRHLAASGGAISALLLYCLERERVHGVLHLQPDPDDPIRNRTFLSRSRQEVLAGTGSRYAPGSVCDGLERIESAPGPCVFVGQPSEITALRKAQRLRPALREKVALAISFFCAGTPATRGTTELLRTQHIDPEKIEEVRYRGLGWPGMFAVRLKHEEKFRALLPYQQSWGALQRFRPYSIYLFPDSSGEESDISCADAWHRAGDGGAGYSLVVVRTERGRQALHEALATGYLVACRVDAARLRQAQQSLLGRRGVLWGRILTFRLLGLPAPRLTGLGSAGDWWKLPLKEKAKSTLGTARRIVQRRYYRPLRLDPRTVVPRTVLASTSIPSSHTDSSFSG